MRICSGFPWLTLSSGLAAWPVLIQPLSLLGEYGFSDIERFAEEVVEKHGHVDFLINNALPLMKGIDDCSWEDFSRALAVGVTAPFYLTKLFRQL